MRGLWMLGGLSALAMLAAGPVTAQTAPPAQATAGPAASAPVPFGLRTVRLANGIEGRRLTIASANPASFEDLAARRFGPDVWLDGQLFMPPASGRARRGVVIIVPGSGGVSEAMLMHAGALTDRGLGVFVLDPFTGRGVTSTVADQSQFTFAGSAHDVLAAARVLMALPGVDPARIGAMGYSRGGTAVLMAAETRLARAVLPPGRSLAAVVAAWPWCGVQFRQPDTGRTPVRFLLGAADTWVSPVQCQGLAGSLQASGHPVSARLFENAAHGFGYTAPVRAIPNAQHSWRAPVVQMDSTGAFIDLYSGQSRPGTSEAAMAAWLAPWAERGVDAGTRPGQTEAFVADMGQFFQDSLGR